MERWNLAASLCRVDALHGLLAIQEVARQFEFNSLRQAVYRLRHSPEHKAIAHAVQPVTPH